MDAYRKALSAYLEPPERTQEGLAEAVGCTQPAINRYANGQRFPDADMARKIAEATAGAVPFDLWQSVAMERLGMGEAA
jgi:transcriptional regulator with XRE-family HTH domain